jgi:hypothetical protein
MVRLAVGAIGLALCAAPSRAADPYRRIVVARPSPYWGYTYMPYVESPLHGMADIVRSQGDWMRAHGDYLIKNQQASMLREKVRQEHLVTRKKELEYLEWERDFRNMSYNNELRRERERKVEYNLKYTAQSEIYTAMPLNSLYGELKMKRPELLGEAGSIQIEPDVLEHIHVTVSGRANIGLLKDDRIIWPRLFFRSSFREYREKFEEQLLRAKELALAQDRNQADLAQVLDDLQHTIRVCRERLDREIKSGFDDPDCNPCHQINGMRFLERLTDTIFALEKPDAAYYLKPLQGKTVAELVTNMKKSGLQFAPATVGCERYYVALHGSLADEVTRIRYLESSPGRKP